MARRTDRRVQRTRKLLSESLMGLILEEGYDAISIQDITDKANLGRATFYLHFKDKDELLLDVMDEFMDNFFEQVPQLSESQWRLEDSKALTKLFDFAAEHYDLYRILIISSGGITASRQLHRSIAKNVKACIQTEIDELGAEPVVPPEFIANHYAGSLLSTIYWWLDSDLSYSVEEMAAMFQKVNQLDREMLMGLNHDQQPEGSGNEKRDGKKRGKDNHPPKKDKNKKDAAADAVKVEESASTPEAVNE